MKSMTIPGFIMARFLLLAILGTTLGLFISLPISPTTENMSEGNTSSLLERLRGRNEK